MKMTELNRRNIMLAVGGVSVLAALSLLVADPMGRMAAEAKHLMAHIPTSPAKSISKAASNLHRRICA